MAELRDASNDVVYRPLSALALVGFSVSCLFGGVVALSALLAILQGAPFFFSNAILLVALAGFAVSWWGFNDIRNSEGVKAGRKLAVAGMWISLVTGAGYFAYSFFTGVALEQQARAFFLTEADESGFFPRLQKASQDPAELRRAFLLTLPFASREGVPAENEAKVMQLFDGPGKDGAPGRLSRFRSIEFVMALVKGGAKSTIEPLGVKSWTYDKGSYRVTYRFRVLVPEGETELAITAVSTEGETTGQKRQWFADMMTMQVEKIQRTTLGEGMFRLRRMAATYASSLESSLRKEKKPRANPPIDATDWKRFSAEDQRNFKERLNAIFRGEALDQNWHFTVSPELGMTDWDIDAQGRLALSVPIALVLLGRNSEAMFGVECATILRSRVAVNPEQIAAAERPEMLDWDLIQYSFQRVKQNKK